MEEIIKLMAQRIKDEHNKHSKHDDNWSEIAARKLFNTYDIYLKTLDYSSLLPLINRVEVIDVNGRVYTDWKKENKVEISFQDEGRTLKVFITKNNDY